MRNFIIKSSSFFFCFTIYLLFVGLWNYLEIHLSPLPIGDRRVIIIGDSHMQDGFNPELFESADNISQPAESLILTYFKLERILKTRSLDTIVIGFSPHNIAAVNEIKLVNGQQSQGHFLRMYPLWGTDFPKDILIDRQGYFTCLFRNMCLIPKLNHKVNFIGSFEIDNGRYSRGNPKAIQGHFPNGDTRTSKSALAYLNKISSLCSKHGVTAIFLATPVHRFYKREIPKSVIDVFAIAQESLRGSGHLVLDYQHLDLPDSLFKNANHLNFEGASVFGEYFKKDLILN